MMLVALWIPLLFTLYLVLLAQQGQHVRDADAQWVLHSIQVKDSIGRLQNLIEDVETSERGYLLTEDTGYLAYYDKALKEIPGQNQDLAGLVADNPRQVATVANLQPLIADKLSLADRAVSLAQAAKFPDAIQVIKDGQGARLMDEIRSQISAMEAEEDRLLVTREALFSSRVKTQRNQMIGLVAVDIVLIIGLSFLMHHFQRMREKEGAVQAEASGKDAMRASEVRYRRLFETAQDGILILDADTGQVVDANPFMKHLLGYSQEEFLGKKLWEIGPFKGEAASKIAFAELQHKDRLRYEGLPLETKAGLRVEVEFISNAFLVEGKGLIQCNIRDITERKKSEQHLALLNTCISNLNDIVMITEAEPIVEEGRRIIFVNEAFTRISGYLSAEAIGRPPRFLQGEKTDPRILAEIRQALKERRPIRRQVINYAKDGTEYWVDIDIVPIFDGAGKCAHFAAVQRDITEQKQAAEAQRTGEKRYRTLFDYAPDGILIFNPQSTCVDANASICKMLGYTRDELTGRHVTEIVAEEEVQHVGEALNLIKTKSDYHREWHFHRKDGSVFEVDVIATLMPDGNMLGMIRDITNQKRADARFRRLSDSNVQGVFFWNRSGKITEANDAFLSLVAYTREDLAADRIDWAAMTPSEYSHLDQRAMEEIDATGASAPYEKEFIRKDGSRVPVLLGAATFEDSRDEGVCFMLDLTERKKLENQFLRAQRMESIGTLAGGVAHDLNNILAPIVMSIDLLKLSTIDPQAKSILETIEVSAKRGTDIVRQVLSFARGLEGERVEVQPNHLLKDLENIIKDTFPKNIRMQFSIPNDTWAILGDPTQVHQILLNLCVNARDAMPGGGTLTISVENAVLDAHYIAMNIQAKVGRYVKISVMDSGMGMPSGIVDKIFEPFFTTKDLHQGTGLGLSTVMAIVKSHEGLINVYSEPGQGTTFKVYLPAMDMSSKAKKQQSEQASLPRGNGEKVLLIDDEASILAITSQTLESFGYRVLTATDGAEALALYAQHRHEIAVVLTDMSMPILDGAATIRALMRINPGVKIIAVSGLTANVGAAKASGDGVKHFLTKPYTAGTLLTVMRAILDQA